MLENTYVKFGTLTTHTYEVVFTAGTLGINLQATRAGYGGYVDTFYRPPDGSILFAEQNGMIKKGDLILEINNEDVSRVSLSELPKRIEKAKRPIAIKFERVCMDLTFAEVVCDPRKMPWYMQYLVETYGIEEATQEQSKLMLWLECDAYNENVTSVPEGDYSDQELLIFKKFFREGSSFSLLYQIPDHLRHLIVGVLSAMGIESRSNYNSNNNSNISLNNPYSPQRKLNGSQLLVDAQRWAEEDMIKGSFRRYIASDSCARMIAYLRFSSPFVKMTLMDILRCDRKSMYLVVFLCQIKRHAAFHCSNILRPKLDDSMDGSVAHAEEILRRAIACVHVLNLQEGRTGIEDLPMLTKLKQLIPETVDLPAIFTHPAPSDAFIAQRGRTNSSTAGDPYIDSLSSSVTLSIPLSNELKTIARESHKKVQEIRHRLSELRLAMLRELSSELMPKFMASKEFEVLLWEIEAHRQFTIAEKNAKANTVRESSDDGSTNYGDSEGDSEVRSDASGSRYGDEDSQSGGSYGSSDEDGISGLRETPLVAASIVPDGAVQRLLRKVSLPGTMTMHRAPLSLLDEARDEIRRKELEPVAWLVAMDTHAAPSKGKGREKARPSTISTRGEPSTDLSAVMPELKIDYILPIGRDRGVVPDLNTTSIPLSLPSFLVPTGKMIWDSSERTPAPFSRLHNLVISTPDNVTLYLSALVMFRPLMKSDLEYTAQPTTTPLLSRSEASSTQTTPVKDSQTATTSSPPPPFLNRSQRLPGQGDSHVNQTAPTGAHSAGSPSTHSFPSLQHPSSSAAGSTPPGSQRLRTTTEASAAATTIAAGASNSFRTLTKAGSGSGSAADYNYHDGLISSNGNGVPRYGAVIGVSDNAPRPLLGMIRGSLSPIMMRGKAVVDGVLKAHEAMSGQSQSQTEATNGTNGSQDTSGSPSPPANSSQSVSGRDDGTQPTSAKVSNVTPVADTNSNGTTGGESSPHTSSRDQGSGPSGASTPMTTATPADSGTPSLQGQTPVKRNPFDSPSFTSPLAQLKRGNSKDPLPEDDSVSISSKDRERDRRVPYGLALVTKTPSLDILRLPLATIASRPELRPVILSHSKGFTVAETSEHDLNSQLDGEYSSIGNDTSQGEKNALVALALLEESGTLRPLRQAAFSAPRMSIPAVLRPGGAHDVDMEMIFKALNPRNIVTILVAFMLEFKIAVVSSKLTSLTVLGEILKTLITPLRWSHIYVPVLPKTMSMELLQCPTPFFVGLLRENFDTSSVPQDVCLLDLENDACRVPAVLAKALYAGRRLARSLDELMRPTLFKCDDVDLSTSNAAGSGSRHGPLLVRDIIRLCKGFVADVLEGVEECCVHCVDHSELVVLFDEAMFINHKTQRAKYSELPADKTFLEQLMRTQCFSMCVATNILRRLDPGSRPPSRPSSPFVSMAPLQELGSERPATPQSL